MVVAGQAREDIANAHAEWREGMTALDSETRVFIDEPKVRAAKSVSTPGWHSTRPVARGSDGALPYGY